MSDKRFFLKDVKLGQNVIDGEEHNHIANVMRLKKNDEIVLIGNDEFDYFAKIVDIQKNKTIVDVFKKEQNLANPTIDVTAYIAMNKRENFNTMVRMLSEIGVSTIVPTITKWTLKQDQTDKIERFQKIADQSTKQCRRSLSLKIEEPKKLVDVCKQFVQFDEVVFAYEKQENSNFAISNSAKKIAFLIGPVAGFDKDEAELIIKSGAKAVSLGKRILKADTATIALASVIMEKMGEWD